jgi:hypothetical protein
MTIKLNSKSVFGEVGLGYANFNQFYSIEVVFGGNRIQVKFINSTYFQIFKYMIQILIKLVLNC